MDNLFDSYDILFIVAQLIVPPPPQGAGQRIEPGTYILDRHTPLRSYTTQDLKFFFVCRICGAVTTVQYSRPPCV